MILAISVFLIVCALTFVFYDYYSTRKREIALNKYLKHQSKNEKAKNGNIYRCIWGEW